MQRQAAGTQQLPTPTTATLHSLRSVACVWHVAAAAVSASATLHSLCPVCVLLQARHLWAFSSLLMAKPETWGFKSSEVRAAADSAFKFMRDNMLRDVEGGENQRRGRVPHSVVGSRTSLTPGS